MQIGNKISIHIFCCYSQQDEQMAYELEMHLSVLRKQGQITAWYNRRIESNKEEDTLSQILQAQIILLLISPDSIASNYWYGLEMKRMLALHDQGDVQILPILLRPVNWHGTPLETFQEFLPNGKPVTSWSDPDEAFYTIARAIRVAIKDSVPKRSAIPALTGIPSGAVFGAGAETSQISKREAILPLKSKLSVHTRRRTVLIALAGTVGTISVIGFFLVHISSSSPTHDVTPLPQKGAIHQGHTNSVWSVAWSPDGKHIASAGEDRTVQVWQASSFQ